MFQWSAEVVTSHLIRVGELELPAVARPTDEGLAGLVRQELQKKLPQLDGTAACGAQGGDGRVLGSMESGMVLVDTNMWLLRGGGSTTVATSCLEQLCVIGGKGRGFLTGIYIYTVYIHIHE